MSRNVMNALKKIHSSEVKNSFCNPIYFAKYELWWQINWPEAISIDENKKVHPQEIISQTSFFLRIFVQTEKSYSYVWQFSIRNNLWKMVIKLSLQNEIRNFLFIYLQSFETTWCKKFLDENSSLSPLTNIWCVLKKLFLKLRKNNN